MGRGGLQCLAFCEMMDGTNHLSDKLYTLEMTDAMLGLVTDDQLAAVGCLRTAVALELVAGKVRSLLDSAPSSWDATARIRVRGCTC